MKAKVKIPYYWIEEVAWCEKEGGEYYPFANDSTYEVELDVDDVEFSSEDLRRIFEKYRSLIEITSETPGKPGSLPNKEVDEGEEE